MLQLTRSAFVCTESADTLAEMRRCFNRSHAIRLPGFLDPELLELVRRSVREGAFSDRADEGIAREQCMDPNAALGLLYLIANDGSLFDIVRRITGCGPIGSFIGRVYRMRAGAGHYDRWHSDMDGARLIGMSVNLTEGEFTGGAFELQEAGADSLAWTVANTGPGDAILFRIADGLHHRVTGVEGHVARVAFAGWFQSGADLLSVLKARMATRPPASNS
jgi:hypothetical protein